MLSPAPTAPTTVATSTRVPVMQGLPNRTSGSMVILRNSSTRPPLEPCPSASLSSSMVAPTIMAGCGVSGLDLVQGLGTADLLIRSAPPRKRPVIEHGMYYLEIHQERSLRAT